MSTGTLPVLVLIISTELNLYTDEKNERSKQVIRAKLKEYIDSAEKLKAFLKGNEGKKPVAQGNGGYASSPSQLRPTDAKLF